MDPRYISMLLPLVQGAINTAKTVPSYAERQGMRLTPYDQDTKDYIVGNHNALRDFPTEVLDMINRDTNKAVSQLNPSEDMNIFAFSPEGMTNFMNSDAVTGMNSDELSDLYTQFVGNMANDGENPIAVANMIGPTQAEFDSSGKKFKHPMSNSIQTATDLFRTLY